MRGKKMSQGAVFYAIDVEELIGKDHPLRPVKRRVDAELARMGRLFNKAYSRVGRPSVPPETLLKAMLLQALYSIRSERQLVQRMRTDLLFRWFCDLDPAEDVFDATGFAHNRPRLERYGIIQRFFDRVVRRAMEEGLTSDDHFSVDGTLIQSYASLKSLKPIEDDPDDEGESSGGRNKPGNWHGQKRSNATHRSTTDPEARLFRKGLAQPGLLYHSAHAVTENRHGLIMSVAVAEANGRAEREEALVMLDQMYGRHGIAPRSLATDKGYDSGPFLLELEQRVQEPQVPIRDEPIRSHDAGAQARRRMRRRMRTPRFRIGLRRRKVIEEAFAWIKTIAGLHRTRLVGRWKLKQQVLVAAAAYNLIRMNKLRSGYT